MFSISRPGAPGTSKAAIRTGWTLTALFTLFMVFDIAIKLLDLAIVDETMR